MDIERAVTEIDWDRTDLTGSDIERAVWPELGDMPDRSWEVLLEASWGHPFMAIEHARAFYAEHDDDDDDVDNLVVSSRVAVEVFCEHIRDEALHLHPQLSDADRAEMALLQAGRPDSDWLFIIMLAVGRL